MIKSCMAMAAFLCAAAPRGGHGRVFLASRPRPEFLVGPLFVVANVSPGRARGHGHLRGVSRPGRATARPRSSRDLYLLWPAEVVEGTAPGPAEPDLAREIEGRGFAGVGSGRLLLRTRDRMQIGTIALGEPVEVIASYVTFTRPGGQTNPVTYIKIPWTPKLADPLAVVTLVLPLRGLVVQKATTWLKDLFWGGVRSSRRVR